MSTGLRGSISGIAAEGAFKMFELFEHKADMGVRGTGKTMEEAFGECAKAMFSVMAELKSVKPESKAEIKASAADSEALLVEWLNALLYEAGVRGMVFSEFGVKIKEKDSKFLLEGNARGEKINEKKHGLKTEVKAATYSQLSVKKQKNKYVAQCIVDV